MGKVLLTAGHSDVDPGAVSGGQTEAALAVEMRNLIAGFLRARGIEVVTDGEGAQNQALSTVIKMIAGKTLALEIHCNASGNAQAGGVECIAPPSKKPLAQRFAASVASVLRIRLRGDGGWIDQAQSAHGKLAFVDHGGLILELFFLSNPTERDLYQQRKSVLARALTDAIAAEVSIC